MPDIFEITDPRGYRVVCTEEGWKHVLGSHPTMKGWEDEVQAALKNPTVGIYQDADFLDRNVYYRLRPSGIRYIKVVVRIRSENEAELITAFPTFTSKAGEKLIWPTSKT
jgi:hypothetical protein